MDRNEERLNATAEQIRRELDVPGRDLTEAVHPIVCDIRNEDQVSEGSPDIGHRIVLRAEL